MANLGSFIPTTDVFDTQNIQDLEVGSPEFKEFLVRLRQSINTIALILNAKDTGYYDLDEYLNGQLFFPDPALTLGALSSQTSNLIYRPAYRKVINFGALPNATSKSVAHGITCTAATVFTRIYGVATKPTATFTYLPLPFASPTDSEEIKLYVDSTNVYVETGSDRTAFTTCIIVLEYIQF